MLVIIIFLYTNKNVIILIEIIVILLLMYFSNFSDDSVLWDYFIYVFISAFIVEYYFKGNYSINQKFFAFEIFRNF